MNRLENYRISGSQFKNKLDENDEICVLGEFLLNESAFSVQTLANAKDHIRMKFIEEALRLIKNLEEHNLIIIHKEKL